MLINFIEREIIVEWKILKVYYSFRFLFLRFKQNFQEFVNTEWKRQFYKLTKYNILVAEYFVFVRSIQWKFPRNAILGKFAALIHFCIMSNRAS